MSLFTEVLASTNYSSLFNTLSNDTTIASNATVNAIQRLLAWVDAGIIEVPQLGEDGNQIPFTSKFITGNAVYLRHWSTWNPIVSFGLGFTPISFITKDTASLDKKGMGVNNGWSLGVYKYSSNQDASVKMIKFMTSKEYQRNSILSSAHPIQPTYPDLLLESGVCHVYGDLCATLQNTITINRPAVITGIHYNRVSQLIANNITALIRDPKTMVASLNYLDGQVNALLGFKVLNGTEILDFSKGVQGMIKKIPTKMGVQFSILMIFMGLCVGGIFYYKKRTENVNRETLDSEIIGFVKSERKEREMDQIEV